MSTSAGKNVFKRHRRRQLVGADKSAGQLVNALMDRLEEMLRLEEVGDAVERLVIDEDGAEQRLFGLDIVRRRTERRLRRSLLARCRIECWHGPGQKNRGCGRFAAAAQYGRVCRRSSLNIADHSTKAAPCRHLAGIRCAFATVTSPRTFSIIQRRGDWESLIAAVPITHCRPRDGVNSALDASRSAAGNARLLAGESQRHGMAGFDPAQARLFAHDVIARRRRNALRFAIWIWNTTMSPSRNAISEQAR